jgi:hypothetical protein
MGELSITADFSQVLALGEKMIKSKTRVFEKIKDKVSENFDVQFDENQSKWKPLSPRYAKQKARIYGEQPILVATGTMRQGYKQSGIIQADKVSFIYPTDYAQFHQDGTRKMPARPMNLDETENIAFEAVADELEAIINE